MRHRLALASLLLLVAGCARSLQGPSGVPTERLLVTGTEGERVEATTDGDIETAWVSRGPQTTGLGLTIQLPRRMAVHRVFLTPGREEAWFPRSLRVLVGDSPDQMTLAAEECCYEGGDEKFRPEKLLEFHPETSLKFPPRVGRFVRIEIGPNTAGYPWSVAELEVYGVSRNLDAPQRWGAVVVAKDAPPPIQLAARELSYYLTELANEPCPIVTPEGAARYRGLHFRLLVPPPEKLPYAEMIPLDTEDFAVKREGNQIFFSGRTQRAVLYAAYEFLYRQGVRWVAGDAHGDYVPPRGRLDLSVLPIHFRPPFATRYANYAVREIPPSKTEDGFLWNIRHHFNSTWNTLAPTLGGVPPRMRLGFGYAHTMNEIIPEDVLKQHPDWRGKHTKEGWYKIPCTTNPELVDYVVTRIIELDAKHPEYLGYGIHPLDVPVWCECDRCMAVIGKLEKIEPKAPDNVAMAYNYSELYYKFIKDVAERVAEKLPGKFIQALAYENHLLPPKKIERLPDNVCVDVCQYWANNLPTASPKNARMRSIMEEWSRKVGHLGLWDYALIHMDAGGEWRTVAPLVRGMADHYQFMYKLGLRHVGTQACPRFEDNPWNYYAYAEVAWHVGKPADEILAEFFAAYYREAAAPMLAYYRTIESHLIRSDIPLKGGTYFFSYVPTAAAFPPPVVAELRKHLATAESAATHWVTRERVAAARRSLEWTVSHVQR